MLAHYPTNPDGLPKGTVHALAFQEATCAQAVYWAANKLDPDAGELSEQGTRVASSKSIKGASVSYDATDAAATKQARTAALTTLCAQSFTILRNAGLINTVIR